MDAEQIVGFGLVAILAVGVSVALWLAPSRRRERRFRAAPRLAIEALTPGALAKVEGTVVLDEVLESPITQARCAYWWVVVSYREYSATQRDMCWYQSIVRGARQDFLLRDASGTVRVACEGARFDLLPVVRRPAEHEVPELPEHVARFLTAAGVPLKTEQGKPRVFGFEERALAEGMHVQVFGQVGPNGLVLGTASVPATVMEDGVAGL